jgi:hypothetical protein
MPRHRSQCASAVHAFVLFLVPPLLLIAWTSPSSPPSADVLRNANVPIASSCSLSFGRQRAVSFVRSVEFSWQCMIRSELEVSRPIHCRRHRHRRSLFLHHPSPGLGLVPLRDFEIVRPEAGARESEGRGSETGLALVGEGGRVVE